VYKKLRYFFRLIGALVGKYYLAIGGGVALGILAFWLAPRILPFLPKIRETRAIAVVGRFTQSEIPFFIQQKISTGLTTLTLDGQPMPSLALKWDIKDNDRTYVFTLDVNKKWQDGTFVRSRDITYNFKDTTVEYPDDSTIVIRLTTAYSPLPVVVSRPIFKKGLVGAGLYKVAQIKRNGQIIESLTLIPQDVKSQLPKLKYLFYATSTQARTAFELGVVRSLDELSDTAQFSNWPNVSIGTETRQNRFMGVFFNTQDPNFQGGEGRNLRLALAYALDKTRWPNRAYGPINPESWAYSPELKHYDLDLVRSKSLLTKVGKKPQNLVITTIQAYLPVAEQIKSDWEKLGIKIEISVTPEVPKNFSIMVIAQAIPADPDQYNLWHSTQTDTNLTGLTNPRIDKLLEDGRKTKELKDRKPIYLDFQKYLVEEMPVIFLYHPQTYSVTRN